MAMPKTNLQLYAQDKAPVKTGKPVKTPTTVKTAIAFKPGRPAAKAAIGQRNRQAKAK